MPEDKARILSRFALLVSPDHLIDLNGVEGLAYIREEGNEVAIGAMTAQRTIEFSDVIKRRLPLLSEAILSVGHRQTRNRGTLGGSLCHLDPAAELPLVAAVLDATILVTGSARTRMVAMVAANCFSAAFNNRMTIVVDDDIDITDINDVLWALLTRCDPVVDLEILKKCWSNRLDPLAYPADNRIFSNRMIFDACISYDTLKDAARVATTSPQKAAEIRKKWPELFPEEVL